MDFVMDAEFYFARVEKKSEHTLLVGKSLSFAMLIFYCCLIVWSNGVKLREKYAYEKIWIILGENHIFLNFSHFLLTKYDACHAIFWGKNNFLTLVYV